jgi:transcriptional regulator with XRE-family HTH domain
MSREKLSLWPIFFVFFPKIYDMMIGDNLKKAFGKEGLIVKEVAKKAGISKGTIDNWLNKSKEPRINALYAVCKAINITMEQAVDGEAGLEYIRNLLRQDGLFWEPPPRLDGIMAILKDLDDEELAVATGAMRGAIQAMKEAKRGNKKGSTGTEDTTT